MFAFLEQKLLPLSLDLSITPRLKFLFNDSICIYLAFVIKNDIFV